MIFQKKDCGDPMPARESGYIDLIGTAALCGLELTPIQGQREMKTRCPLCRDYKKRMYLCTDPDNPTWWCHNCGNGGNAVTLYAAVFGVSTKEAYRILIHSPAVRAAPPPMVRERPEPAIRALPERSRIYLDMLQMMDLESRHRRNLLERGLTDALIQGNMYRTLPADWRCRQQITDRLAGRYDLTGVPGFYVKDGEWRMAGSCTGGYLIPVCDKDNLIQGLQIRLDDAPPVAIPRPDGTAVPKKGSRYRWFSSGNRETGTPASCFIHTVGDQRSRTLYLTEGPLKADVSSYLSGGGLFLGLTGVQNLRYLPDTLRQLRPHTIVECIDMDVRTNPDVQRAQARIRDICIPLCRDYRVFHWPTAQKGIDDYLLFQKLKAERRGSAA